MANEQAKPTPSYSPMYAAALYPDLAVIARKHGYALAVHGSLRRDFDLVAVPWADVPSDPQTVVDELCRDFMIRQIGKPEAKIHGRTAWTISIGHGECALDLSFMPTVKE
jgi:hypothetical protein